MKTIFLAMLLVTATSFGAPTKAHEDWKGDSPDTQFNLGFGGGLAFNGPSSVGGILLGSAATKISPRGFVPDINNQVFLEVQAGPEFFRTLTVFTGSLHLRWDFHRNEDLSLFAVGGLGTRLASGLTQFYPRLGLGMFYRFDVVDLRLEISQNWFVIGASFDF